MPTLSADRVPTIYRDEYYKAVLSELPLQANELEEQGYYDCFGSDEISTFSTMFTHVYHNNPGETARNPGEELVARQMGQGYNYYTVMRSESTEVVSIEEEYLGSVVKLGDYAALQGRMTAENYHQQYASYWSDLVAYGAIAPATLDDYPDNQAGQHKHVRMYNHYLKGSPGPVIANITNTDAADPDGKAWFTYYGNEHVRANGDTSASYAGKTLGFFNAGSSSGTNMFLTEANVRDACLHAENDLPWGADRIFRAAPLYDTLIVSGNLRIQGEEILNLNEYRLNTPHNDKNTVYRESKCFALKNLIVNRFWPDNCWVMCASGRGVKKVRYKGEFLTGGVPGPVPSSKFCIFNDLNKHVWIQQFFAFWSFWMQPDMDIAWYAGSLPTTLDSTTGRPVAPTTASLTNW